MFRVPTKRILQGESLKINNGGQLKLITVSKVSSFKEVKGRLDCEPNGVTYFLFSECGLNMKIGRVRAGDVHARIKCAKNDPNYKKYSFTRFFTLNNWKLEDPLHQLFRHNRATVIDNNERLTYREYCLKNGWRYRRSETPILYGCTHIELFRTGGLSPDQTIKLLSNQFETVGIKLNINQ